MLRNMLLGLGAVGLMCGGAALATGTFSPDLVFGFWGGLLVIGIVYERVIYKPVEAVRPGAGWQRTTERCVDDTTGKIVTVYVEPGTGERAYVAD